MVKPRPSRLTRDNLGFLLAKAAQRWNELLHLRFAAAGFAHVRPAYGSILIPLFEEDGLQIGELARRAGSSKQTMTTMLRQMAAAGLVERRADPGDGRAARIYLTAEARRFRRRPRRLSLLQSNYSVAPAIDQTQTDPRQSTHFSASRQAI